MDAEVARSARTRDIELKLLLDAIYLRYHYDFRSYAVASLRRRMTAALARFGCETVSQLQERLLHDPTTFPQLLDYLTVQVSEMFRDPAYFLALRERVVPLLRTYPSLKVWVAGCSTGEEAYSLAILLREEGLDSCMQEAWAVYTKQIRESVEIPDDHIFFCGMAIGWGDREAAINRFEVPRAGIEEVVTWQGF